MVFVKMVNLPHEAVLLSTHSIRAFWRGDEPARVKDKHLAKTAIQLIRKETPHSASSHESPIRMLGQM